MKIIITAVGTRGDMEPFLAIGEMLKLRGHQVICLFPEQFSPLAKDSGLEFASLGHDFIDMLNSETGRTAMGGGGSGMSKFLAIVKMARMQKPINQELVKRQYDTISRTQPDCIIHNGKAMYPVLWEIDHPGKTVYLSPVPFLHYVKGHTHVAFNSNYGEFVNKLTFKLADWGLIKTIVASAKWLGLPEINTASIRTALDTHKIIYTISPTLFQRPDYWGENMKVLGFHERNKLNHWRPDADLEKFLSKHSKILFITFGSMMNPSPEKKTKIIIDILERQKITTIINTAAGGLVEPATYDKNLIYFVSNIPYDWIFPKVFAVVHHGGSGTTHLALKYGCASMIIPHIIDQFVWNRIIHEKAKAAFDKLDPSEQEKWELHVVGHSAGSIFAGYALSLLSSIGMKLASVQLMAPAITVAEFKRLYLPLIESDTCPNPTLYILSDEAERDDTVGPYGKSLLYLVSNAFEDQRGTPLLGMERYVHKDNDDLVSWPDSEVDSDVESQFRKRVNGLGSLIVAGSGKSFPSLSQSESHGGFDNDPETMNSILWRVRGSEPTREFHARDLHY